MEGFLEEKKENYFILRIESRKKSYKEVNKCVPH